MSSRRIVLAPADGEYEMDIVRTLFREYAAWLKVDYCLQDFEAELADLPGKYAPPGGGLWLARVDGRVAGTIAFWPLDDGTCEMRRFWVREAFRGLGLGPRLAEVCVNAARAAGYSAMSLETLDDMTAARALYEDLGFREIPRHDDKTPDAVRYMRRVFTAEDLLTG
jgi:ribosomal protein S18 acetylase RimI-like enzyme